MRLGLIHAETIGIMEGFMHGTFDRRGKSHSRTEPRLEHWILCLPVLFLIAPVGLAVIQPAASIWISEAAQAEFVE